MARKRAQISPAGWSPGVFHGVKGFTRWRVTAEGILREGETAPRRTQWAQAAGYAERAIELYGPECRMLADIWDPVVDFRTLIATICCESAVNPDASRYESHINDTSFGLCQLLTAVAWQVGKRIGWPDAEALDGLEHADDYALPGKPRAMGGAVAPEVWGEWLRDPWNNLGLCTALHYINDERLGLKSDPLLQYIAYNSGGNYASGKTDFGMHYHPNAADAFVLFFNDASALVDAPVCGP